MRNKKQKRKELITWVAIIALILIVAVVTNAIIKGKKQTDGFTQPYAQQTSSWEAQTAASTIPESQTTVTAAAPQDASVPMPYGFDPELIPDYSGTDVLEVNGDEPFYTEDQKVYNGTYILLSELDDLGRCGPAMACVGQETEPSEKRGDISEVHPSGWEQMKYNGGYLYNRSHLLMFALTGLNDDKRNLITGTEYFNQTLMLGWESMVLWAVDNMNAHVVYRVTPVFEGDNLVAKGVLMEAYCIEYPEDCTFCRFVYNIADPAWNVEIDYATGNSYQR